MNTKIIKPIKRSIIPNVGEFWTYTDSGFVFLRIHDETGKKICNGNKEYDSLKTNDYLFYSLCIDTGDITYTGKDETCISLLNLNLDNKTILKKKFTAPKVGECWQWCDNVYMRISDELSEKLGDIQYFVSVCLNSPNGNSFTITPKRGYTYHYKNLKFSNDTLEFNVI